MSKDCATYYIYICLTICYIFRLMVYLFLILVYDSLVIFHFVCMVVKSISIFYVVVYINFKCNMVFQSICNRRILLQMNTFFSILIMVSEL